MTTGSLPRFRSFARSAAPWVACAVAACLHLAALLAAWVALDGVLVLRPTAAAVLASIEVAVWCRPLSGSAPRWLRLVVAAFASALLAALVVALPIHNASRYAWCARDGAGAASMLGTTGAKAVVALGLLFHVLIWPRIDPSAQRAIARSPARVVSVVVGTAVYLGLWRRIASCNASLAEHTAVAALAAAAPIVIHYLLQAATAGVGPRSARSSVVVTIARRAALAALLLGAVVASVAGGGAMSELRSILQRDAPDVERRIRANDAIAFEQHDACLILGVVGDETSVPRLIWAMPEGEVAEVACTVFHCMDALVEITNHAELKGRRAWEAWYAERKHESRIEWIRDGYVAAGLEHMAAESPRAARTLLADIGAKSGARRRRPAEALLATYDTAMVAREVAAAAATGSPDERRGAILVAFARKLPGLEAMLAQLAHDLDASVRHLALTYRTELASRTRTNPEGYRLRTVDMHVRLTRTSALDEAGVLYSPLLDGGIGAYDTQTGACRWTAPRASDVCLDGDHVYATSAGASVYKLRARDGTAVWKSAPIDVKNASRLDLVSCDGDYTLQGAPFATWPIVVRSKVDGQVIATGTGRVVSVRDGIAYVAGEATLFLYQLPNLEKLAELPVGSDVLDVAVGADVIAVVKTDASRRSYPRRGSTWVEGWSRDRGRVWGPRLLGESARDHHGLVQTNAESCYVSQGGRVTALRIDDGRVLWESAPDGEAFAAGRQLVILGEPPRSIFVLDAATGDLTVRYDFPETWLETLFVHGQEIIGTDLAMSDDNKIHAFRLPPR